MRPVSARILELKIPFRFTFKHSLASRSSSDSIVLALDDSTGEVGYGECAPREYVSGESVGSVLSFLRKMTPRVFSQSYGSLDDVRAWIDETRHDLAREEHAAFCALELALLDLFGRLSGESSATVCGPIVHHIVRYSGVVSADHPDVAVEFCKAMRHFGIGSVKVKVGSSLEEDYAVLTAVRQTMGEGCTLRIDANCAWDADTTLRRLTSFAEFSLEAVEQPCAAEDLEAMAAVTAGSSIPVIADESLVSLADAHRLVERRACSAFNIRISKCGGLLNSAEIRDVGAAAGMGFMLGAQVGETAILSAAGRQLATRSHAPLHLEGSYGKLLLEDDIGSADLTLGPRGDAPALTGAGLGVTVDRTQLARFTVTEHTI
jgi:muconate cycloisomerase